MNYESMLDNLARWDALFGGGIPSKKDIEAAMRGDVDGETLWAMKSYTHTLERGTVSVKAACIDPPEEWSLDDFETAIAAFAAAVPPKKRSEARVTFKGGYDETSELAVIYSRPQTEEEWGLDIAHALMHVREINGRDIAAYERVKQRLAR